MAQTENIKKFIQLHYTDERLAEVLAHTEDGKMSFHSCCCLIGAATATHALCGKMATFPRSLDNNHYYRAITLKNGIHAEAEYRDLDIPQNLWERLFYPKGDAMRRKKLIPILKEEIARRDAIKKQLAAQIDSIEEKETVEK